MKELQDAAGGIPTKLEGVIGHGQARIGDGSTFRGQWGTIARFHRGTFRIEIAGVELPFGCSEICELTLSKSDGSMLALADKLDGTERMALFLQALSLWAEINGTAGMTIVSDPDAGPGTMRWRAE